MWTWKHALAIGVTLVICVALILLGPGSSNVTDEASSSDKTSSDHDDDHDHDHDHPEANERCAFEFPELLDRVAAFEAALYSRDSSDTNESLRAELAELAIPSVMDQLTLDVEADSSANRSLANSVISASAEPTGCDIAIRGTADEPTAYAEVEVTIRKFQDEAEVWSDTFSHQTWWRIEGDVWVVYSLGGGSS